MRGLTAAILVMSTGLTAWADESAMQDRLETMTRQMQAQQQRIDDLEARLARHRPASREKLIEFEKGLLAIRNQLSQAGRDTGDLTPGWLSKDLTFEAEITVSYYGSYADDRAYTGGVDGVMRRQRANDSTYTHQMLYALKFGFVKTFGPEWEGGFTLGSTLGNGNDGFIVMGGAGGGNGQPYFGEDEIGIYKAYIRYTPEAVPGLSVVGGKFDNPLTTTDLIWDAEITPEGLAQRYEFPTEGPFKPFLAAAQLIAREQPNDRDIHCFAWQAGFTWERIADTVSWTSAFAFYDWNGFEDAPTEGLGGPAVGDLWPLGDRVQTLCSAIPSRGGVATAWCTTTPATSRS